MSTGIVLTGLGTIGSFGCGREALLRGLAAGEPRLTTVERPPGYHRRGGAQLAAATDASEIDQHLSPRAARRMSWLSRFGVAAAHMAVADAGLGEGGGEPGEKVAILTATTFGSPTVTEKLLRAILEQGPEAASPMLFPESVANAPAAQIAIALRARGPNLTLTQRAAGPLLALGRGAREIRRGRAKRALVGVADEIHPIQHAVLDRFRALATDSGEGERARPFCRRRNGFLLADGATMVMLEREADAKARGARILGRLLATGTAFDPSARADGWGQGEKPLASGLLRCLAKAKLDPRDICLVVSGANGSLAGDALEAKVLRRVWGEAELPPILAPKAVVGEHGGGYLAAAALAAAGLGRVSLRDVEDPCPHLGASLCIREAPREVGPTLLSALAPGGAAAWILLDGEPQA